MSTNISSSTNGNDDDYNDEEEEEKEEERNDYDDDGYDDDDDDDEEENNENDSSAEDDDDDDYDSNYDDDDDEEDNEYEDYNNEKYSSDDSDYFLSPLRYSLYATRKKKKRRIVTDPRSGPDVISKLPDCVLTSILSRLPIRQSARTSVLSRRWRHLWTQSPLKIDTLSLRRSQPPSDVTRVHQEIWWFDTINTILRVHQGPILSCRLWSPLWVRYRKKMDRWMKSLTKKGIQEIDISTFITNDKIPRSIFRCQSLKVLEVCSFRFPSSLPPGCFVNLRELHLSSISIRSA